MKYVGLTACFLILAMWYTSMQIGINYHQVEHGSIGIGSGVMSYNPEDDPIPVPIGWSTFSILSSDYLPFPPAGTTEFGEKYCSFWLLFCAVGFPTSMLFWRSHRYHHPGYCRHCGYNLFANVSGICPECGTPIPDETQEKLAVGLPSKNAEIDTHGSLSVDEKKV